MAKLSAHGRELGRIEYLTKTKAYFANGDVLVNYNGDWTVYGETKAGFDPVEIFNKRARLHKEFLATHPAFAAYRKALIDAGHSRRSLLHVAIVTMPDDPDGVWAECNDMLGMNLTIDEVVELCHLYKAAIAENGSFVD